MHRCVEKICTFTIVGSTVHLWRVAQTRSKLLSASSILLSQTPFQATAFHWLSQKVQGSLQMQCFASVVAKNCDWRPVVGFFAKICQAFAEDAFIAAGTGRQIASQWFFRVAAVRPANVSYAQPFALWCAASKPSRARPSETKKRASSVNCERKIIARKNNREGTPVGLLIEIFGLGHCSWLSKNYGLSAAIGLLRRNFRELPTGSFNWPWNCYDREELK